MKAILVSPESNPSLAFLTENTSLPSIPVLGKCLLERWLEHFAGMGVSEVIVQTSDRSRCVSELVGNGERWGLKVKISMGPSDLDAFEEIVPPVVCRADRLPGDGDADLLSSYEVWFKKVIKLLNGMQAPGRLGAKQIQPNIWVGKGSVIAPTAQLIGPCWIGENVRIGEHSIIGPNAILEDCVIAETGAEITESWVGPETFVGELIRVRESIAWGSTLINWQSGSCISVPDAFLLSSIAEKSERERTREPRKFRARLQTSLMAWPSQMLSSMRAKLRG
jgi:NDP-sugar pyrophosphorylase family protein